MSNARRQSNEEILALIEAAKPLVTYLKDVKSSGTASQALTVGSYAARTLNTQEGDTTFCTLINGSLGTNGTANQFTLIAGTYRIRAEAQAMSQAAAASASKIKLRNITAGTDVIIGTPMLDTNISGSVDTLMTSLEGTFTISATTTFEIQQRASVVSNGGSNATFGDVEVYTTVKLEKVP